jgi:hypothetical protein
VFCSGTLKTGQSILLQQKFAALDFSTTSTPTAVIDNWVWFARPLMAMCANKAVPDIAEIRRFKALTAFLFCRMVETRKPF